MLVSEFVLALRHSSSTDCLFIYYIIKHYKQRESWVGYSLQDSFISYRSQMDDISYLPLEKIANCSSIFFFIQMYLSQIQDIMGAFFSFLG